MHGHPGQLASAGQHPSHFHLVPDEGQPHGHIVGAAAGGHGQLGVTQGRPTHLGPPGRSGPRLLGGQGWHRAKWEPSCTPPLAPALLQKRPARSHPWGAPLLSSCGRADTHAGTVSSRCASLSQPSSPSGEHGGLGSPGRGHPPGGLPGKMAKVGSGAGRAGAPEPPGAGTGFPRGLDFPSSSWGGILGPDPCAPNRETTCCPQPFRKGGAHQLLLSLMGKEVCALTPDLHSPQPPGWLQSCSQGFAHISSGNFQVDRRPSGSQLSPSHLPGLSGVCAL